MPEGEQDGTVASIIVLGNPREKMKLQEREFLRSDPAIATTRASADRKNHRCHRANDTCVAFVSGAPIL